MARTRAVVLGGSMAGLCAARALHASFDEVVLLERDAYPAGAEERPGVPQARHVHALLARGWIELERLFPGFNDRMRQAGVQELDAGLDFATLRPTGWARRMPIGLAIYLMTRDRTESIARDLLRATGVEMRDRVEVTGLRVAPGDPARVVGVTARARDGGAAAEIDADLVVDATGRSSKAPAWLAALGLPVPSESIVDSFAGYSSRWYRAPDPARWPADWWWRGVWIDPEPPGDLRGGVLFPVEDGRWIVTTYGYARRYPPSDAEGFTKALGTLRSRAIAEAVALAEPISPVYTNRALSNRFRHYERLPAPIRGFTATGDSVCVFNPIYGQGMTVAALCAVALRDTAARLGPSHPDLGRAFFEAQARVFDAPWALAAGADLRFPDTEGERIPEARFIKVYTDAIADVGRDDEVVNRRAMEVFYLLEPIERLFAPSLVARIAAGSIRHAIARRLHGGALASMPPPA